LTTPKIIVIKDADHICGTSLKICTPASPRTEMTTEKQALHKPLLGTTAVVNFWLVPAE
jgi:hypothetical protein